MIGRGFVDVIGRGRLTRTAGQGAVTGEFAGALGEVLPAHPRGSRRESERETRNRASVHPACALLPSPSRWRATDAGVGRSAPTFGRGIVWLRTRSGTSALLSERSQLVAERFQVAEVVAQQI